MLFRYLEYYNIYSENKQQKSPLREWGKYYFAINHSINSLTAPSPPSFELIKSDISKTSLTASLGQPIKPPDDFIVAYTANQ